MHGLDGWMDRQEMPTDVGRGKAANKKRATMRTVDEGWGGLLRSLRSLGAKADHRLLGDLPLSLKCSAPGEAPGDGFSDSATTTYVVEGVRMPPPPPNEGYGKMGIMGIIF